MSIKKLPEVGSFWLFGLFVLVFDGGEKSVFDVLFFLLFRSLGEFDVDFVAGEFAGKANVLALATDGDGLLVFCDENFGVFAVDFDFCDLGRREGFTDIFGSVVGPVDDVDFFAVADFVHDGLDADATTTNESTDWIDAGDVRGDSDFCAATGFAGDAFDFYGAVFDFGDFLAEKIFDKFGATAREDELGAGVFAFDIFDVDFDAGADGIVFAVDLFRARNDTVGFSEVDADELWLDARDDAGHDSAEFVLELGQDDIALSFTQARNDDLFGGHRGDATETGDFVFFFNDVADFLALAGGGKRNFCGGVVGDVVFDDFAGDINIGFACVQVQSGANVHFFVAVIFAPSGGDCSFDDAKDNFFRKIFFFGDDFDH